MMGRHVEELEVRQVVLNLAAAVDLEAHVGEDGPDGAQGLRGGMQPAAAYRTPRQRDIERLRRQAFLEQLLLLLAKGLFMRV